MVMMQHADLIAIPLLAILVTRFSADSVSHFRGGHQVALVCCVDEHLADESAALACGLRACGKGCDRLNAIAVRDHALLAIEPLVAPHVDNIFADEILEHPFRHMRLEGPHGAARIVHRRRALPHVAERVSRLPSPCLFLLVVFPDAVIKFPREPADHRLVAGVGKSQPAARQAAQMNVGRYEHHRLPHPFGLNGGDYSRRRAAIHDYIELFFGR